MQYRQKGVRWFAKVIARISFLTWDMDAARNPFSSHIASRWEQG